MDVWQQSEEASSYAIYSMGFYLAHVETLSSDTVILYAFLMIKWIDHADDVIAGATDWLRPLSMCLAKASLLNDLLSQCISGLH